MMWIWRVSWLVTMFLGACAGGVMPGPDADSPDMACRPPVFSVACSGLCDTDAAPNGPCVCIPYVSDPGTCNWDMLP